MRPSEPQFGRQRWLPQRPDDDLLKTPFDARMPAHAGPRRHVPSSVAAATAVEIGGSGCIGALLVLILVWHAIRGGETEEARGAQLRGRLTPVRGRGDQWRRQQRPWQRRLRWRAVERLTIGWRALLGGGGGGGDGPCSRQRSRRTHHRAGVGLHAQRMDVACQVAMCAGHEGHKDAALGRREADRRRARPNHALAMGGGRRR